MINKSKLTITNVKKNCLFEGTRRFKVNNIVSHIRKNGSKRKNWITVRISIMRRTVTYNIALFFEMTTFVKMQYTLEYKWTIDS